MYPLRRVHYGTVNSNGEAYVSPKEAFDDGTQRTIADEEQTDSSKKHPETAPVLFCVHNVKIDTLLSDLHDALRRGVPQTQIQIDTLLLAASCPSDSVAHSLIQPKSLTLRYDNIADLTRFAFAFFANGVQDTFFAHVTQQISPLRRRVRQRRGRVVEPQCAVETSVCMSLLQALLFGLYPRSCKTPVYQARRKLAVALYHLRVKPFATQKLFVTNTPSLLKLALTEYWLNVRLDFCPVEQKHLSKCVPQLAAYDQACSAACDSLRQSCLQQSMASQPGTGAAGFATWSWKNLEAQAAALMERIGRLARVPPSCVARLQTNTPISKQDLNNALNAHVQPGACAISGDALIRARVHKCLQTHMLPSNIVSSLARRLINTHKYNPLMIFNACCKNFCMKCLLGSSSGAFVRSIKLRMDTRSGSLVCASCNQSDAIVRTNVFGKLLQVEKQTYFVCVQCTMMQPFDPAYPLQCTQSTCESFKEKNGTGQRDASLGNGERPRGRKRECVFCKKPSLTRPVPLLHARSARTVYVTMCFKHTPPPHMWKYILDTTALFNYVYMQNETTTQSRKRRS